jgi:hypothetical protein
MISLPDDVSSYRSPYKKKSFFGFKIQLADDDGAVVADRVLSWGTFNSPERLTGKKLLQIEEVWTG